MFCLFFLVYFRCQDHDYENKEFIRFAQIKSITKAGSFVIKIHLEKTEKEGFYETRNQTNIKATSQRRNNCDFEIQTDHLISARRSDFYNNQQKKRTVDFAVPVDHRVKLKDIEKKDKYLDLATELKKVRNMKVTVIPIVIGTLNTVT